MKDFPTDQSVIGNRVAHSSASHFCIMRYLIHTHADACVMPWGAQASKGPAIFLAHETTYGDV